ncbi:neurotrimin-like [Ornithodoros turicata]|uniref:neurotrimin-like n=1 Tax=Ornithodoros turicata TaxID=34597 RepID=UPI003138CA2E
MSVTGLSNVRFRWLKDGEEILQTPKSKIRTFPELSNLILGPLEESDSGNYTCMASQGAQSDSYTDTLRVLVPVKWVREPTDVSLKEYDNVTLSCEATGVPRPTVTWEKEGSTDMRSGPTLRIEKVTKGDSGRYNCKADNGLSQPISKTVNVLVYGM